jgi:O-succinylbenzoate synthase
MHEFGIGRAANVAIASLPGFTLPGDVSGSDKYYRVDLVEPPILADRGAVPVPTGPGLGHRPLIDRIGRRTLREWAIDGDRGAVGKSGSEPRGNEARTTRSDDSRPC